MLDKIQYFSKLSSIALITLLKIFALALVSTLVSLTIGIIALLNAGDSANVVAPHASGAAGALGLIAAYPIHSLLIFLIFCGLFLITALGYKYVLNKLVHRITSDKAESLLSPLLDKVISKFRTARPGRVKSIEEYTAEKLQMVQAIKKESENVWVRRALSYGLSKIKITDADLKGDVDFYEVMKLKVLNALKEATEPGKTGIWIVVLLQVLFAFIMFFI
jgi:hypothetical protein